MGLFGDLYRAVRSVAQVAVRVVVETAAAFVNSVKANFAEAEEKYREIDVSEMKRERFRDLEAVNDAIHELSSKKCRDGWLSENDKQLLAELIARRRDLRQRVDNAREYEQAQDISKNSSDYESEIIDPASPNSLTRLAGQAMLGKPCSKCGRPMALRWRNEVIHPTVRDLFWGCTGYFVKNELGRPECSNTERLSRHDEQVFAVVRPGMELAQDKLTRIVEDPRQRNLVKRKLNNHLSQGGENYLCPVHHVPLRLKEKSNPDSLLDTYYLRCPRCDQSVKIKSAVQLDEIMSQMGEGGLFSRSF